MKQTIKGTFEMVLRGVPFVLLGSTRFESERGSVTKTRTLHLGPFVLGFNWRERSHD